MCRLLNLTPHDIVIRAVDGTETTYPASGWRALIEMVEEPRPSIDGIPVICRYAKRVNVVLTTQTETHSMTYREFITQHPDRRFIVSSMVLDALGEEAVSTYAPDTGSTAIRHNGQVVAVTRLVQ